MGSPRAVAIMPRAKAPTRLNKIHATFFSQFMREWGNVSFDRHSETVIVVWLCCARCPIERLCPHGASLLIELNAFDDYA